MYRENDNGYHSGDEKDGEDAPQNIATEENDILRDLDYDGDITLNEPNYESLRTNRFERNLHAMKYFDRRVSDNMSYGDIVYPQSEEYAAIMIQKHVRGFLARRQYIKLLLEQFEKEEQIRSKKIKEQIDEANLLVENHRLEVQFEEYNVTRRNKARRLVCYVITIQRAWRNYLSRRNTLHNAYGEDALALATARLTKAVMQKAISELLAESPFILSVP